MSDHASVTIQNTAPAQPTLEELAAKMDAENPVAEVTEERPSWLPEKFKTVEDFAKSYSELEKKLGQGGAKETPAQPETPATPETKTEVTAEEKAAREATANAGLDFDALSAKFAEAGALEETDYAALEKAGIPKSLVDAFISGQEAIASAAQTEAYGIVGGAEQYDEMISWAASNLSPAEIKEYDSIVNGDNMAAIKFAIKGLKSQFDAANGTEPTRIVGGNAKPTADVYESLAQMEKDMASEEYRRDPAFRAKVAAKLGRSSII